MKQEQLNTIRPLDGKEANAVARAISELGYAAGVQPNAGHARITVYPEDAAAIRNAFPGVLADLGLVYAWAEEIVNV